MKIKKIVHHIQWMLTYYTSCEGKSLEDPWERYDESMLTRTVSVENAPDKPQEIK